MFYLSDCKPGTYGTSCIQQCGNCADNVTCDIKTGQCPGNCEPGWYPPMCNRCK